jgi:presenilin-like A22 family membrane protease
MIDSPPFNPPQLQIAIPEEMQELKLLGYTSSMPHKNMGIEATLLILSHSQMSIQSNGHMYFIDIMLIYIVIFLSLLLFFKSFLFVHFFQTFFSTVNIFSYVVCFICSSSSNINVAIEVVLYRYVEWYFTTMLKGTLPLEREHFISNR